MSMPPTRGLMYYSPLKPSQPATILWGRLAACGRVGAPSGPGLPACLPTPRTFGCGYAALWGSQSWLQPAFSRRWSLYILQAAAAAVRLRAVGFRPR
jgi:hypothetical protein